MRNGLAGLLFCLPALAQITGDLVIRVTDPSDAAIAGAKVSLKNSEQGASAIYLQTHKA